MAEPYIGEIRLFPFNFAPVGWAVCNGATLPVNQYAALYSLIGNTYGGTANVDFKLPDLRGRVPVHPGPATSGTAAVKCGQMGGSETVALTNTQMPEHTHPVNGENDLGNSITPIGGSTCLWSLPTDGTKKAIAVNPFSANSANCQMDPTIIISEGGGAKHENMQPYLVTNFCIALTGYYPQRP